MQESVRSKVYVAMDFSGEDGGRVLDNPRDILACDQAGPASKDGYVPFRYWTYCFSILQPKYSRVAASELLE